jgi:hypothetical protein
MRVAAPKIRERFVDFASTPISSHKIRLRSYQKKTTIMKFAVSCIVALLASHADAFSVQHAAQGQRTFGQSSALKFMPAKDVSTSESSIMKLDASSLAPVDMKKNDSMARAILQLDHQHREPPLHRLVRHLDVPHPLDRYHLLHHGLPRGAAGRH